MSKIKQNIILVAMLIIYAIIVISVLCTPSEPVQDLLYGNSISSSVTSTMIYSNNGNKVYLLKDSKTGQEWVMTVNVFNNVTDIEYKN